MSETANNTVPAQAGESEDANGLADGLTNGEAKSLPLQSDPENLKVKGFSLSSKLLLLTILFVMLSEVLMILIIGFWMFVIPGGLMLVWRDWQFRAVLRESIETARCLSCGQSLIGVPLLPGEGAACVRCPECGTSMKLEDVGLTPEDLSVREG